MKFNARQNATGEQREAFVEWLVSETATGSTQAAGDPAAIRAVVFLYLSRAYEANLEPDEVCNLLGVSPKNAMSRATLTPVDERAVLGAFEALDPILEQQYSPGRGHQ